MPTRIFSLLLFIRVTQTASLQGYPELEHRHCDKVVILVQGRIKHKVYSGRYPDVVTERYFPVHFYSVLITHRSSEDLVDRIHVQQADSRLSTNVKGVQVRYPGGQCVFRKGAAYAHPPWAVLKV